MERFLTVIVVPAGGVLNENGLKVKY